jgi:predicted NBD/HSP70 family sugar kinase
MSRTRAARPDSIRRQNLALLLERVHLNGELTRADLTAQLGLNRSTIGELVADLTELGVLREDVPVGGNRAGRPSYIVGPRTDGPYVIGVDVEVDRLSAAAVEVGGTVLARRKVMLDSSGRRVEDVAEQIASCVRRLGDEVPVAAWPVGVGVSIPGTVARADGRVEFAPALNWRRQPLGEILAALLPGLPINLGNDADLGMLAEHLRGRARGYDDVVYLIGKIGVGAGILVDGVPLRGYGGLAGEVGHTVLDPSGPACHCGRRGCVETFIGDAGIIRAARRRVAPSREAVSAIFAAARTGDQRAVEGVRKVGEALGRVLADLVNLLNPRLIILGGSLAGILELARRQIEAALDKHAMEGARAMVEMSTPGLSDDSSSIGAAELAFDALLKDPSGLADAQPRTEPVPI